MSLRRWMTARFRRPQRAVVLTYHSIGCRTIDLFGQAVSLQTFERQLHLLKQHTTVVPAATLADYVRRGRSPDGLSAVTFDDGYSDALSTALPVLEHLEVPMTLFVTTEPVAKACPFWWGQLTTLVFGQGPSSGDRAGVFNSAHARLKRLTGSERNVAIETLFPGDTAVTPMNLGRPLTSEELRQLAQHRLIDIGAHTVTHPSLASLSADDQRFELVESRRWLGAHLARPIELLAYPFGKAGDVSELTISVAKAAGYHSAFVTTPAPVTAQVDVMAIPRLTVHEWSDAEFERRLRAVVGN